MWVINGFFEWYPLQNPDSEFPDETYWAGPITAVIGATIFEFGSVLLMLEAVNENRVDCFGLALEDALESGQFALHLLHDGCKHSHREKNSWLTGLGHRYTQEGDLADEAHEVRTFSWWPTWYELRTHYFKEIGFLACFSQMIGATVFWVSGFTGLPPILNSLSVPAQNGIFWLPQVRFAEMGFRSLGT